MIGRAKEDHPSISERELCRVFEVSRSWYYECPSPEEKAAEDLELRDAIERIVLEFPGYGYRRVTKELHRRGWAVNHKRVLRVMRQESLLCQLRRRFKPTTDSAHSLKRYPNLLKEALIDAPDTAWSADITYVRLPTSFCYLASILDRVQPLLRGLGTLALHRHSADALGPGDGARRSPARPRADPPLRPGSTAVRQ